MAGIQLSGLASGFDWKSVVDQLIAIERTPQTKLRTERATNLNKVSAFTTLQTKLSAFQTSAKALSSTSLFSQRTISQGDETLKWTATAAASTPLGEYDFNVTKLATRSVRQGTTGTAAGLNASADVSGLLVSDMRLAVPVSAGRFTINGASVAVELTDSLQDVFTKISTATGGNVSASYNAGTDGVTLSGSGPITLGGGGDTSNFLYALKLRNSEVDSNTISSASRLGSLATRDDIASAGLAGAVNPVDGNGTFTINGVQIAYNVNNDSLQGVMARVNTSEAGVSMGYDAANDRFTLTNKNTGDLGLTIAEDTGGLLAALNLGNAATVTRGDNAEFSLNGGGTMVTSSNVFDSSTHGINGLTVTASSLGSQTVTVGSDTAAIDTGLKDFIAKFNDIQTYVDSQTRVTVGADGKVSAGLMAGNREFTDIARQLRTQAFSGVAGAAADMSRLESIGIDFEGSSSLLSVRDSAKLANALSSSLDKVSTLFSTSETGISGRIDTYISRLTITGGVVDSMESSLERQNSSIDRQIADLERRLTAERERLERSFIAMEEAQSKMNSQLASLGNILG